MTHVGRLPHQLFSDDACIELELRDTALVADARAWHPVLAGHGTPLRFDTVGAAERARDALLAQCPHLEVRVAERDA